jgi:hypothetical protein
MPEGWLLPYLHVRRPCGCVGKEVGPGVSVGVVLEQLFLSFLFSR